jgi:hypothetical protein
VVTTNGVGLGTVVFSKKKDMEQAKKGNVCENRR